MMTSIIFLIEPPGPRSRELKINRNNCLERAISKLDLAWDKTIGGAKKTHSISV